MKDALHDIRPFDLPTFVLERAIDKGAVVVVIAEQDDQGNEARGYNWRGKSWKDGADFWRYRYATDPKGAWFR